MDIPLDLAAMVREKIDLLGDVESSRYFDVSEATIGAWRRSKNDPSLAAAQKLLDDSLYFKSPEIWQPEGAKVAILFPVYEFIQPYTFTTLLKCIKGYGIDNIRVIPKVRTLIDEARNDLAERALLTNSEYFIFIDADQVLPCGSGAILKKLGMTVPEPKASRNAITRLMSHPKEYRIVGALYRDRRGGTKAQCNSAFVDKKRNEFLCSLFSENPGHDKLEEERWVGFGMVRIHRSVFEEMKEAAKHGGPLESIAPPKGREGEPYGYFGRTSQARGEDVVFCVRALSLGIKTYVDTGCILGHDGRRIY